MDEAQRRGLTRLMLRWPDRRDALRRQFRRDQRLVELCEAYETACEAVNYWSKRPAPVGPARAQEYQALASATEQDVLIRLA